MDLSKPMCCNLNKAIPNGYGMQMTLIPHVYRHKGKLCRLQRLNFEFELVKAALQARCIDELPLGLGLDQIRFNELLLSSSECQRVFIKQAFAGNTYSTKTANLSARSCSSLAPLLISVRSFSLMCFVRLAEVDGEGGSFLDTDELAEEVASECRSSKEPRPLSNPICSDR